MNKKLDGLPQRDYLSHPLVSPTAARLFVVNTRDLSAGREHKISREGTLEKGKGKPPAGHRSLRSSRHPDWTWSSTGLLMEPPASLIYPLRNAVSRKNSDCTDNRIANLTVVNFTQVWNSICFTLLCLIFIILNIYKLLNSIIHAGKYTNLNCTV